MLSFYLFTAGHESNEFQFSLPGALSVSFKHFVNQTILPIQAPTNCWPQCSKFVCVLTATWTASLSVRTQNKCRFQVSPWFDLTYFT